MSVPRAPEGAGPAGRRLWSAVLRDYELAEHETVLLRQAVHVADLCEQLQQVISQEGPLLDGKPHPGVVELRQQRIVLARLIVALRVPLGDEAADSKHAPARLQRRAARGVYQFPGTA